MLVPSHEAEIFVVNLLLRNARSQELGFQVLDHGRGTAHEKISGSQFTADPPNVLRGYVAEPPRSYRDDPEVRMAVADLEELGQKVGLVGAFRTVVEIDPMTGRAETSGHTEEGRHPDATGDPDLVQICNPPIRESAVWPLYPGRSRRIEVHQVGRVVAQGFNHDPQVRIVG